MTQIREIRLYRPGDEEGITRLFKEVFGREMSMDEWRWKYTGVGNKKVYSTVAVSENNEIVAHYGGIPMRMILNSEEVKGIAICDVMVHPRFRYFNIFRRMVALLPEETVKEGFIEGYGFPCEREMRLALRLGLYEKVEDVWEATREVSFKNDIARYGYKLFPLGFDDERIDALWETVRKGLRLAVIRDRRYLDWRFRRHVLYRYELWGLRSRLGRRLLGLAVLRRTEDKLLIMDYVCPDGRLPVLLKKIENYAYSEGFRKLALWMPEYLTDTMTSAGFAVAHSGTAIPRTTCEGWLRKDEVRGRFFYTMGDTDFL